MVLSVPHKVQEHLRTQVIYICGHGLSSAKVEHIYVDWNEFDWFIVKSGVDTVLGENDSIVALLGDWRCRIVLIGRTT